MYEYEDLSYSTKMIETITTIEDWAILAKTVLSTLVKTASKNAATILVLSGDLGAGKTTFTKALATELGVQETVNSPTFTIMKRYTTTHEDFTTLIHMDAYRIESLSELQPLHFQELLQTPQTLLCIEWGERIEAALPKNYRQLSIVHKTGEVRSVTFQTAKD